MIVFSGSREVVSCLREASLLVDVDVDHHVEVDGVVVNVEENQLLKKEAREDLRFWSGQAYRPLCAR